jgi:hypothetical protein
MNRISPHVRRRIADLGRLSRPLGEAYACELAANAVGLVSKELDKGGNADRILEIYEARIAGEVEKMLASARRTYKGCSSYDRVANALPKFSSADLFDLR